MAFANFVSESVFVNLLGESNAKRVAHRQSGPDDALRETVQGLLISFHGHSSALPSTIPRYWQAKLDNSLMTLPDGPRSVGGGLKRGER